MPVLQRVAVTFQGDGFLQPEIFGEEVKLRVYTRRVISNPLQCFQLMQILPDRDGIDMYMYEFTSELANVNALMFELMPAQRSAYLITMYSGNKETSMLVEIERMYVESESGRYNGELPKVSFRASFLHYGSSLLQVRVTA